MPHPFWMRGMLPSLLLLVFTAVLFAGWSFGVSSDIVISQVYGGGGHSGATYRNDYIELFNRGVSPINLNGWSVQYASSVGSSWINKTDLPAVLIPAGGYFLIQEASSGAVGDALPAPDATGNINLSSTSGKIALVCSTTALTGTCPTADPSVVDFVGYGLANCYEGIGPVGTLATNTAAVRQDGGCVETDNNIDDFYIVFGAIPHNSASLLHSCGVTLSVDDVRVTEGHSGTVTASFTVSLSGQAPSAVIFDIATADGTATVADGDYVPNSVTGATIETGAQTYQFDVAVNGDNVIEPDETFYVNVTNISGATAADAQGGGLILDDDIVELTIDDVSVTEGDTGTTPAHFAVTLSRPAYAGGVSFEIHTQDGTAVPPDDYQSILPLPCNIPEGQTQYAFDVLVNGDTVDESNEFFGVIVDHVTGTAVSVVNATGSCIITNDDSTAIHDIQGSGSESPLTNTTVVTRGIVTARTSADYFIQSPESLYDADPNTSEGLLVTGTPPWQLPPVGADVVVIGTVSEYVPESDPYSPPLTQLIDSSVMELLDTGQPLPAPIVLSATDTSPSGDLEQLEKYEGMLVEVPSLTVIAPTQGSITEWSATATSNGIFYGVISGINRPAREPGIAAPEPIPIPPCCIPRFDGNPERLRVDGDGLIGARGIHDVTPGVVITNLVGALDYRYRTYTIMEKFHGSATTNISPVPVVAPTGDQATVATFNMLRFFNDIWDSSTIEVQPVLATDAFNNRLAKASLVIRTILQQPDIIGVQEIENLATLQAIATKINTDVVAGGGTDPQYVAYLQEGHDFIEGLDVGFLVKSTRVTVDSVTQYGKDSIFSFPGYPDSSLYEHPPLVLDGRVNLDGAETLPLMVIVNHLCSMSNITDPTEGPRVRAKRQAQAEYLASLIQGFQAADPDVLLASVGDYNAYPFSDGYVDVMGTVRGDPAPADEVLIQVSNDLVEPNLLDLFTTVVAGQAYSSTADGNTQSLDHILVNSNLMSRLDSLQVARVNADFPLIYYEDSARPERISDHDPVVAYFSWNPPMRGDLNSDGFVDAADIAILAAYFAGNGSLPPAVNCDLNYDAAIDLSDLVWLQNEVGGNNPAR